MYNSHIRFFLYLLISGVILFTGCKDKRMYPDVSHINVDVNLTPFFKEFHAIDTLNIEDVVLPVYQKYPEFMEAYCQRIIRVGARDDSEYVPKLTSFLTYQANKDILKKTDEIYPDFIFLKQELIEGLKHYKYYFPNKSIPEIYLMISGFSQSIAVDQHWLGLSVEKYLGEDCEFYEWLGIPKYLRKGMVKEKMAPDVLRAMALTNFPTQTKAEDVINSMIYKGKIKYFVKRMFPDLKDTLLFDYSKEQMQWCKKNESEMWASLVEWKHLFQEDRMLIQKYTGDAPFSANFGNNSAPRAGEFIGYKIVSTYMKENEEVSLQDLMNETDGRKILAASNYRP